MGQGVDLEQRRLPLRTFEENPREVGRGSDRGVFDEYWTRTQGVV